MESDQRSSAAVRQMYSSMWKKRKGKRKCFWLNEPFMCVCLQLWRTPAPRWPAATVAPASSRRTACRLNACAPSAAMASPIRWCVAVMGRTTATSVNSTSKPARTRRTSGSNFKDPAVSPVLCFLFSWYHVSYWLVKVKDNTKRWLQYQPVSSWVLIHIYLCGQGKYECTKTNDAYFSSHTVALDLAFSDIHPFVS